MFLLLDISRHEPSTSQVSQIGSLIEQITFQVLHSIYLLIFLFYSSFPSHINWCHKISTTTFIMSETVRHIYCNFLFTFYTIVLTHFNRMSLSPTVKTISSAICFLKNLYFTELSFLTYSYTLSVEKYVLSSKDGKLYP